MPKLHEFDHPVLKAFLLREANDYNWRDGIEGPASIEFQTKMFNEIQEHLVDEKFDHIEINSLTNMGLIERVLKLTPVEYQFGRDLVVNLPPSPRVAD